MADRLSPAIHRGIVARVAAGDPPRVAAAAVDPESPIHPATFRGWMRRGNAERTRLELLGIDPDEIDRDDPRITDSERAVFALVTDIGIAEDAFADTIASTLVDAAVNGVETLTETYTVTTDDNGHETRGPRQVRVTRQRDMTTARFLAERRFADIYGPPTQHINLSGSMQVAGFTDRQAEGFTLFVRAMLDHILGAAPARTRERLERAVPAAIEAGLAAIDPPREEEPAP